MPPPYSLVRSLEAARLAENLGPALREGGKEGEEEATGRKGEFEGRKKKGRKVRRCVKPCVAASSSSSIAFTAPLNVQQMDWHDKYINFRLYR